MNNHLKGVLYVATGAASYGILATFVKFANNSGVSTASLTFSQYFVGAIVLTILSFIFSKSEKKIATKTAKPKLKLILFGSFLGLTSSFYYLSIQYVPVSVGIILLMQTIWMGVILEYFTDNNLVSKTKIIGAIAVIAGTILAAKVLEENTEISLKGIGFGLLAAASYTGTMYATNKISLNLPLLTRSKYLVIGGLLSILIFWNIEIFSNFDWIPLLKWGAFLGFFGTILPPVLFNKGIPEIGTGLGSIIAALEIPVSVFSAYLILNEQVTALQWLGIIIIILSVIYINLNKI